MKKYFIIAVAAIAAMAACSKVDSTNEGPQQKIAFQVASYVPMATKAETTTSFPGSGGSLWNEWATGTPSFYAIGYFTPAIVETGIEANQDFMVGTGNGVQINPYNGAVGTAATSSANTTLWAPALDYYWPKTGIVNFFSWASVNDITAKVDASALKASKKISFGTSSNPITVTASDNILLADACYNAKGYGDSANAGQSDNTMNVTGESANGVPTLFRHVLSRVGLTLNLKTAHPTPATDGTDYVVTVVSASLNNILDQGYLELTNNGPGSNTGLAIVSWWDTAAERGTDKTPTVGWTPTPATPHTTTIDSTPASTLSLTLAHGESEVAGTANNLLAATNVMPQTMATDGQQIEITYKVEAKHGSTRYSIEKLTATGYLKSVTPTAWGMNQSITYIVTIDPVTTTVTFDPAVVEWTAVEGGEVAITD